MSRERISSEGKRNCSFFKFLYLSLRLRCCALLCLLFRTYLKKKRRKEVCTYEYVQERGVRIVFLDEAWISWPLQVACLHLLRGTIVNRTYDAHKNLYISLFFPTIFGPINNGLP